MEGAILQYSQYRRVDCDQKKSERLPDHDNPSETNEIMSLVKMGYHLPRPALERKASDNDPFLLDVGSPSFARRLPKLGRRSPDPGFGVRPGHLAVIKVHKAIGTGRAPTTGKLGDISTRNSVIEYHFCLLQKSVFCYYSVRCYVLMNLSNLLLASDLSLHHSLTTELTYKAQLQQ